MPGTKVRRTGLPIYRRDYHGSFKAVISGAQTGNLAVPITKSRTFTYDTAGATDPNPDISRYYQRFGIQVGGPNAAHVHEVAVEISMQPGVWVAPPPSYTSDAEDAASPGVIAAGGGIFFMELPIHGVEIRCLVTQPDADTDMQINVLMSENSEQAYERR